MDELPQEDEVSRLKAQGYMEQNVEAGAFSCGACKFLEGQYCKNKKIDAKVSATNGCCNLFYPSHEEPRNESEWAVNKKDEEE